MDCGKRHLPARNRRRNPIYCDSAVFEKKKPKARKSSRKIVYRSDDEEIVSKENRYGLTRPASYKKVFDRWNRSVLTERNVNLPSLYSEQPRSKPAATSSNKAQVGSDDKSRRGPEISSRVVQNDHRSAGRLETGNDRRRLKTRIATIRRRLSFRLGNGFSYSGLNDHYYYRRPDRVAGRDYTVTRVEWMTVCRQLRSRRGQHISTGFGRKIGPRPIIASSAAPATSGFRCGLPSADLFGAGNCGRCIVRISLERPICRLRYAPMNGGRQRKAERIGNRIFGQSEMDFGSGTIVGSRSLFDSSKSPIVVEPKERLAQTIVRLKRILEHKRVEVQKFRFLNDAAEYSLRYRTVLPDDLNVKYAISVVTLNAINDDLTRTYSSLRSSVNEFISFNNNENASGAELSVDARANELVERHRTRLPSSSALRQEGPILKLVRSLTGVMLRLKQSGEANGKSEHCERGEKLASAMNRIKDTLSGSNAALFSSCVQKPIMTIQRIVSGTLAD